MVNTVLKACHLAHKGVEGTLRLARDHVFWPSIKADITKYIQNCQVCGKMQKDKPQEPILLQETPKRAWSFLGPDLLLRLTPGTLTLCN